MTPHRPYSSNDHWYVCHILYDEEQQPTVTRYKYNQPEIVKNSGYFALQKPGGVNSVRRRVFSFVPPDDTQCFWAGDAYWYAGGERRITANADNASASWYPFCTNGNGDRTWTCQINVAVAGYQSINKCFANTMYFLGLSLEETPNLTCRLGPEKDTREFRFLAYKYKAPHRCFCRIMADKKAEKGDISCEYWSFTYLSSNLIQSLCQSDEILQMLRTSKLS